MQLIAQRMLNDVSEEGEFCIAILKRLGIQETVHTIKWGGSVSSGAVDIQAGYDEDDDGTWETLTTITFDGTAPYTATYKLQGPYPVLRHYISTVVTDGTVRSRIDGS